jgi:hypothetical protein
MLCTETHVARFAKVSSDCNDSLTSIDQHIALIDLFTQRPQLYAVRTAHALSYINSLTLPEEIRYTLGLIKNPGEGHEVLVPQLRLLNSTDRFWKKAVELCDKAEKNLVQEEKRKKVVVLGGVFEVKFQEYIAGRALKIFETVVDGRGYCFIPGVWYMPKPTGKMSLVDLQDIAEGHDISNRLGRDYKNICRYLQSYPWYADKGFDKDRYYQELGMYDITSANL